MITVEANVDTYKFLSLLLNFNDSLGIRRNRIRDVNRYLVHRYVTGVQFFLFVTFIYNALLR